MTRNSDMRYFVVILVVFPLFAIWGVWEGWQSLFLKGIAFNYVWPSVLLLAEAEIFICYSTDSVKATTVGALIMAVSFILMVDWPAVIADPGNWEIDCSAVSALTMAIALLSFAFIWLKFNEFTVPKNVKWIPMVLAIVSCILPMFATSAAVEDGRTTLFQICYLATTWSIIYEMTRDMAGDKPVYREDCLSYLSMAQCLVIAVCASRIASQEDGWGLVICLAVISCFALANFANGGHIEGAFFDGVKIIVKQPDLLIMFVAQLVEIACVLWFSFNHELSSADALLVSEIVRWAAIVTAGLACIRLNQMQRGKKQLCK